MENGKIKSTFSIIIPTYNRAKLLTRCVKSCLNQTYGDFELIIVDDGSTDNTPEVIRAFDDPRIIYERLLQNQGCNAARNKGLDLAKGQYVIFQDSDDEFLQNALDIFLDLWRENNNEKIGNIVTRMIDNKTRKKIGYLEKDNLILGYQDIICRQKSKGEFKSCWKKDAIGNMRFPEDISAQDYILWGRLAKKWNFLYKDIPTAIYYKDSILSISMIASQIKNAPKLAKGAEILLDEHSEIWKKYCPERYLVHLNSAAFFNLMAGNKNAARNWALFAVQENASCLKSWALFFLSFVPYRMFIALVTFKARTKNE